MDSILCSMDLLSIDSHILCMQMCDMAMLQFSYFLLRNYLSFSCHAHQLDCQTTDCRGKGKLLHLYTQLHTKKADSTKQSTNQDCILTIKENRVTKVGFALYMYCIQ